MKTDRYVPILLYFVIFIILLQGCAKKEAFPQINTTYVANNETNPDISRRPSPVVVMLFQLSSDTAFKNADFFSLYNNAKTTLGASYLYQEQIEIKPNQQIVSNQDILPDTRFIAVIAAYRDIDNSQWRKWIAVDGTKSFKMQVLLGKNDIKLQKL